MIVLIYKNITLPYYKESQKTIVNNDSFETAIYHKCKNSCNVHHLECTNFFPWLSQYAAFDNLSNYDCCNILMFSSTLIKSTNFQVRSVLRKIF